MKLTERQNWLLNKLLPGILFLGLFSFLIYYYGIRRSYQLDNYGVYTIGITQGIYRSANQIEHVDYTYNVKGVQYKSSNYYRSSKVPGGRHYVKYSSKDPGISEIYQDK